MALLSGHVCRRAATVLAAPRLALAAGQCRCNVAARLRRPSPRHRPAPRGISMAAATLSVPEGVPFEELVDLLEVQYGLAERFVRGSLSELAEILGYHAGADPIIQFGDATILLEEIGAPPVTPEEFGEFKASRLDIQQEVVGDGVDAECGDSSVDHPELSEQSQITHLVQSGWPDVVIDRPPRLFRGR